MTKNEIQSLLFRYGGSTYLFESINMEIRGLRLDIEHARELSGINLDGSSHKSGISDRTEQAVEKIVDKYEKHINEDLIPQLDTIIECRQLTEKLLSVLNTEERRIIEAKYFQRLKWNTISRNVHMSLRTCQRIEAKAIFKMSKVGIK